MNKIQLTNDRWVGEGNPPFIVAEIGLNHNGDVDLAQKLIKKAKKIGVDAVKFQVKDIEEAHPKELLDMPYEGPNSYGKTYREHKQALELSQEDLEKVYKYAKELGIICFSTPCNVSAVKRLEQLDNPIYKIASVHVTNLNIIEEVAKTGKPIILSTGMSEINEIDNAVNLIRKYTEQFALLHCVSCYPADYKDLNLRIIPALRERYNCPVGYSGHERGVGITHCAMALDACILERHFTLDRTMKGPDHAASLEPAGFELLVGRARNLYLALGTSEKRVLDCELAMRKKFRDY